MPSNSFRQVDEKHVSAEARHMCWSPKMDLLVLANIQGEVVLHRLSWQKVWTLAPPSEGVMASALCWRPDGKVIGVGYTSGRVLLVDIEDASVLNSTVLYNGVSTLTWIDRLTSDCTKQENNGAGEFLSEQVPESLSNADRSSEFLPKLPTFNKTFAPVGQTPSEENFEDMKELKDQKELNILVAGTSEGCAQLFAYGVFPIGVVDLKSAYTNGVVSSAFLSRDLQLLVLLVEVENEAEQSTEVIQISYDTSLLASHHKEIRTLALKFGQVASLLRYLEWTIQQMTEAWEDILLEMDSKLAKFAEDKRKVCGGSVSNDLLRLLMFGVPSDELQNFLLHDLTEKGLKKLGHSIETSYSNIQKLVLRQLLSVVQALVFQMAELRGMAQSYQQFGILGLSVETLQQVISTAGSFMLKASELQQVIDGGIKNFKAFFRRLYVVIQRLSDAPVPPELTKMTQQDINFVAQFLAENFTEEPEEGKSGFKLEKVGQYLKDEDLVNPRDNSNNTWVQFLQQSPKVQANSLLYEVQSRKSLVQMHNMLLSAVDEILQKCASGIGQTFQRNYTQRLYSKPSDSDEKRSTFSMFSKNFEDKHFVYTVFSPDPVPCERCFVLRQPSIHTESTRLEVMAFRVGSVDNAADLSRASFSSNCSGQSLLDWAAYDDSTVALLLEETGGEGPDPGSVLTLLPLVYLERSLISVESSTGAEQFVCKLDIPIHEVGGSCENEGEAEVSWRRLEHMRACQMAVSGTRKVACVLFSSRRRVRLFMMDAEDEDDENDVTRSTIHDVTVTPGPSKPADVRMTSPPISEDDDENKENSHETSQG